jgi:two-component system chemotaxis response regulator CheB
VTGDAGGKKRVLIIDDSSLMRKLLTAILSEDPELEVVGAARDPYDARDKIKALRPDVLTLDIEMPRMDGLTFLSNLMRLHPLPVVMISSMTEKGADATLNALALGAIDWIEKPRLDLAAGMEALGEVIIEKVKTAAQARPIARERPARADAPKVQPGAWMTSSLATTDRLIAIGASTGGTEAIADLLDGFPPDAPGTVIVQHIPEVFSARFAARLDEALPLSVREARDGDEVLIGHVYVAPGGRHLRVIRSGARYVCRITDEPPRNRHRPSVDVLFESVATAAGCNAVGVLLTGMGADGAEGLLGMKRAGSPTLAQDQASSVVWGMPREAVKRGAADEVLPLAGMAARAIALSRRR